MDTGHTVESLRAFESEIAELFNRGEIKYPIHLSSGNEAQLIELFKQVQPEDWVCGSWRMHFACLLKGIPPHVLRQEIINGHSITLCFPKSRIVSSAIVGGILPIATGIALGIKLRGETNRVFVFSGDMTSRTGTYHECLTYAQGHDLPITFVQEDNGISVGTPTADVWGPLYGKEGKELYYHFDLGWPHSGTGKFVEWK
jgi:TPP-dependent pyruvate/acetoin dehydrogenase alpha subunit